MPSTIRSPDWYRTRMSGNLTKILSREEAMHREGLPEQLAPKLNVRGGPIMLDHGKLHIPIPVGEIKDHWITPDKWFAIDSVFYTERPEGAEVRDGVKSGKYHSLSMKWKQTLPYREDDPDCWQFIEASVTDNPVEEGARITTCHSGTGEKELVLGVKLGTAIQLMPSMHELYGSDEQVEKVCDTINFFEQLKHKEQNTFTAPAVFEHSNTTVAAMSSSSNTGSGQQQTTPAPAASSSSSDKQQQQQQSASGQQQQKPEGKSRPSKQSKHAASSDSESEGDLPDTEKFVEQDDPAKMAKNYHALLKRQQRLERKLEKERKEKESYKSHKDELDRIKKQQEEEYMKANNKPRDTLLAWMKAHPRFKDNKSAELLVKEMAANRNAEVGFDILKALVEANIELDSRLNDVNGKKDNLAKKAQLLGAVLKDTSNKKSEKDSKRKRASASSDEDDQASGSESDASESEDEMRRLEQEEAKSKAREQQIRSKLAKAEDIKTKKYKTNEGHTVYEPHMEHHRKGRMANMMEVFAHSKTAKKSGLLDIPEEEQAKIVETLGGTLGVFAKVASQSGGLYYRPEPRFRFGENVKKEGGAE